MRFSTHVSGFQDRTNWLIASLGTLVANIDTAGGNGTNNSILDARYFTVGAGLLWALEDSLGGVFSPALEEAWAAAFYNYSAGMFPTFEAMSEAA